MPIYRYQCSKCKQATEYILPMNLRDKSQTCQCGAPMTRVMAATHFRMHRTGKDEVTDTLNREYKTLPPKQVELLAGGLNEPEMSVIGRGFG